MQAPTPDTPTLSVVIATFNRRKLLEMGLAALEEQTVPTGNFEVIVIDDGSSDDTAAWLAKQQFNLKLHKHSHTNQGIAGARNRGIEMARGEYVLFLDDDLIAEPQLIAEHLRIHEQSPNTVVLGPASSLPSYPQPWVAWQQYTLEKTYRALTNGDIRPSFRHFWGGNCSISRDALLAAGCFDRKYPESEDIELGYRLEKNGLKFTFNPEAKGFHHSARGFASWRAAHAFYGRAIVDILSRSGEQYLHATLQKDWWIRHPLTRLLAGWTSHSPLRYRLVTGTLSLLVQTAKLAPNSRLSRFICAALANVLFWNGVRASLGESWQRVVEKA